MVNNTLYLIGGTGGLGQEVAKGLVTAQGFDAKKALVRDGETAAAKSLAEMGWTLEPLPDYTDASALQAALAGAKTVVSTVSGNDMVSLETALIKAAKVAGASLFVPSQFGVDYRRWGTSFPFLAGKKAVLDAAASEGLATLSVFVGYFSDWIFGFFCDLENEKVTLVGDGSAKISFTRRSDIGHVLAKALEDPAIIENGTLSMLGDLMSLKDAIELLGKVLGKNFQIEYLDPQDALEQEQELLQKGLQGDVGSFYASFGLHLKGEPARGNDGCDLSAEAKDYGFSMETLESTFKSGVYGPPVTD